MSNRTFKTQLNNQKYVLFDYGQVESFPDADSSLAGICNYNDLFYIKQKDSDQWKPIYAKLILTNVSYGYKDDTDGYDWYNNIDKTKVANQNKIMIWNHGLNETNLILTFFGCELQNGQYQKINVPYMFVDSNNIAIDFTGFENYWFYIVSN